MVVFLFSVIYLLAHFGICHTFNKWRLGDGPNTIYYALAYYTAQITSPIFIFLLSLLITGASKKYALSFITEMYSVFLGLILVITYTVIVISLKREKIPQK